MALEIRPATLADLTAFYGEAPQRTMRAWAAVLDGEPIGVAGVIYQRPPAPPYLFSDHKPEMRSYRKAMITGGRAMLKALSPVGLQALCDPSAPGSHKLLSHLGFEHTGSVSAGVIFTYRGA